MCGYWDAFTRLAAVFAEEVGGFGFIVNDGLIYRCIAIIILRIHICTCSDEKLGDSLVTPMSRKLQSSVPST